MPSPKKLQSALDSDPVLWAAPPLVHPPLDECCNEPVTAAATRARRIKAERVAAEEGKGAPRISEFDLWPVVVRHGFENTADDATAAKQLMAWAKKYGTVAMCQFLFKIRARLPAIIDDIWEWERVETTVATARLSRMEALVAAKQSPCVCQAQWLQHVLTSFRANGINVAELCHDISEALKHGRGETTPVLCLAGVRGGEGKSLFLKALFSVFGDNHVFTSPQAPNFPLLQLPGKKVVFLDEWRFTGDIIPWSTQCLWFDGSRVTIPKPQNGQGMQGHSEYRGSAPILATTKLADLKELQRAAQVDPETGEPFDADASMVWRRLKVYEFRTRIPKPQGKRMPFCGSCFARLLLQHAPASTAGSSANSAGDAAGSRKRVWL